MPYELPLTIRVTEPDDPGIICDPHMSQVEAVLCLEDDDSALIGLCAQCLMEDWPVLADMLGFDPDRD